jgi:hypothetical protein
MTVPTSIRECQVDNTYKRVLETQLLFFHDFHPRLRLLKDVKSVHIEDYKPKRFAGEIVHQDSEEEKYWEECLRKELKENPRSGSPQANAKYGWLGRKRLHQKVTQKTINYEIQCLQTFLHWAIRQNYLFSNPATRVERFRVSKKLLLCCQRYPGRLWELDFLRYPKNHR